MIKTDHKKISHGLKKRGWQDKHIAKVINLIKKGEKKKDKKTRAFDDALHLILLFFIVLGNIFVLVAMLPIILGNSQWVLLFVLSLVGLCFGYFIDHLLREFSLTHTHYVIAGIILPMLALSVMLIVFEIARNLASKLNLLLRINPLLSLAFYITAFSLPHLFYKLNEHKK